MTEESDSVWLSQWESNLISESQDKQQNIVDNLEQENLNVQSKLWGSFQNCATSIAKVYVERENQKNGSEAFRDAARDATLLYKDGVEMARKLSDMGMTVGYNRRNKEILQWVRKRRRFIRRDELIAMLCGGSAIQTQPQQQQQQNQQSTQQRKSPTFLSNDDDSHLDTFREAIQSIGTTNISNPVVDVIADPFMMQQQLRASPTVVIGQKRSNSPLDVNMDSPSHKRHRYF
ncbi:unnamed protein product [Allacma fusca]|uniref:Uncharacterized protein n=1 Tax=Allacma fusca TaxID=39272 RepID=A0A8J2K9E6_9HEXA|nr:unnamed protein product [Allacma fusca]